MKFPLTVLSILFLFSCALIMSCADDSGGGDDDPIDPDTTDVEPTPFDINSIEDTYPTITAYEYRYKWGPYNVHDPSVFKDGDYYYCYSTDASYGNTAPPGLQMRRSKDLVEWEFKGLVFNGLPTMGSNFIKNNGGTPFNGLWAPDVMKVGNEYRLYYSLSSPDPTPRLSVIGLATATSPLGVWTEKGLAVTSLNNSTIQTNAIDPSVIIDKDGQHWMYYGSAWDGIYVLKLNPTTGLANTPGDKGVRIAQRGFTGNKINGNIEGSEIIYNPALDKYYLFIAYDWLETKYNVRVGRADSPEGPFYDYNGHDLNEAEDNIPMIIAPYKFAGHSGWQGVSHPTVFDDGNGQFYIAHQGRPGGNIYYMVLHVRKLFWTEDGWPMASPERYAGIPDTTVTQNELAGTWEQIVFNYTVVPGYAAEQISPDFQSSVDIQLDAAGTINNDATNQWTYAAPWLTLNWNNGARIEKVYVHRGRDWENKIASTLLFTGFDEAGKTTWGKKKME